MSADAPEVDPHALADALDVMRETLRAMVAGLVADGFTDDQAHAIVTVTVIRSAAQ